VAVPGLVRLARVTAGMTASPETASEPGCSVAGAERRPGLPPWGAALSVVPAILAVVVGELARIRSLAYWVPAGGVAAVAVPVLNGLAAGSQEMAVPGTVVLQTLATAGFAAGVAYWALAGRSS
jgi:hypothetical protein